MATAKPKTKLKAKPKAAKPKAAKSKAAKPKTATKTHAPGKCCCCQPKAAPKRKSKPMPKATAKGGGQHGDGFLGKIFPVLGAMGL